MSAGRDLTGQKFGRLTAKRVAGRDHRQYRWLCVCDCGEERLIRGTSLTTGNTSSCGCMKRELMSAVGRTNGTHRLSRTPEYAIWNAMRQRCYVKKNPRYKYIMAGMVFAFADAGFVETVRETASNASCSIWVRVPPVIRAAARRCRLIDSPITMGITNRIIADGRRRFSSVIIDVITARIKKERTDDRRGN